MDIVWDTGAITLFFADHAQAKDYMKKISQNQITGYVPRLILTEFYYKTTEKLGKEIAQIRIVALRNSKLIEEVMEEDDIFSIGSIKLSNNNLSLADCTLGSVAMKRKATILTTESGFDKMKAIHSIKLDY